MSESPTPTFTYYVTRRGTYGVQVIEGVTGFTEHTRVVFAGWYRDTGTPAGSLPTSAVPVSGEDGEQVPGALFPGLRWVAADEIAHIPPRPLAERRSGYLFALRGAELPGPYIEPPRAAIITANVATNIISSDGPHELFTGDEVSIHCEAHDYPGGISPLVIYTVVVIDDVRLILMGPKRSLINITTAGSGIQTMVRIATATSALPPNLGDGLIWIPHVEGIDISTSDPRKHG